MTLVVFLQEDEDVLSVYRNLKIFCETAPISLGPGSKLMTISQHSTLKTPASAPYI